jgi:hypothetical protein
LEYFMAIMDMSPCPYFNTQIKNIEATSFLTQGVWEDLRTCNFLAEGIELIF